MLTSPPSPFTRTLLLVAGFVALTACLSAGEWLQHFLGLILPGNIIGLFLLLGLLGTGALPLRWVESAAGWLLWFLPLLFMPIFTLALKDRGFWQTQGREVALGVAGATLLLWAFVGHLTQWFLPREHVPPASALMPGWKAGVEGEPQLAARMVDSTNLGAIWLLPASLLLGVRPAWSLHVPDFAWSFVTVGVYFACRWVFRRTRWPLLYPGLSGIVVLVFILEAAGRAYPGFARGTAWINWLLGPAVVAMAVPIYQLRDMIRANVRVLGAVIPLGLLFAVVSTSALLASMHRPRTVIAAGTLKSITSPVGYRLAVDAHISTDATLAGILIAGMLGATVGPSVLRWMRVRDERAVGLALGCSSHGIGVARSLDLGRAAGAYASLGMSGTAILGALILPYVLRQVAGGG